MIPSPPVPPKSSATPLLRALPGTGFATTVAVFLTLFGLSIARAHACSQVKCKPDTSLLGPLIAAGPVAWLIASFIVGILAMAVHAAIRWRRSMA